MRAVFKTSFSFSSCHSNVNRTFVSTFAMFFKVLTQRKPELDQIWIIFSSQNCRSLVSIIL